MSETKKPDPYTVQGARSDAAKGPKPSAPTLRFSARIQDGVHVIKFEQSNVLDAHEIEQLGDDIYHHLKPVDTPRVVIDLQRKALVLLGEGEVQVRARMEARLAEFEATLDDLRG